MAGAKSRRDCTAAAFMQDNPEIKIGYFTRVPSLMVSKLACYSLISRFIRNEKTC